MNNKKKKKLVVECQSAKCHNEVTSLLVFEDRITKLVGSCSTCLSKTPEFDFGYLDLYRKYENFEVLSFQDIDKVKIKRANIECGFPRCYEKSTYTFIGIIITPTVGFIYLFYRCKEHFMKNNKKWKNLRVIEL